MSISVLPSTDARLDGTPEVCSLSMAKEEWEETWMDGSWGVITRDIALFDVGVTCNKARSSGTDILTTHYKTSKHTNRKCHSLEQACTLIASW